LAKYAQANNPAPAASLVQIQPLAANFSAAVLYRVYVINCYRRFLGPPKKIAPFIRALLDPNPNATKTIRLFLWWD
jgi:hypothetical protein